MFHRFLTKEKPRMRVLDAGLIPNTPAHHHETKCEMDTFI
jgi:hypothetical protein